MLINRCYGTYFVITSWTKKVLWFCSCMGLMFVFPMAIEYMGEQNRILMKLTSQMGEGGGMGGGQPQMEMRPF